MHGHTSTAPDYANPFADTDPPALGYKQVVAALERARKRRAAVKQPDLYWEEPGHHGRGREVSLRGKEEIGTITGRWSRKALRLPPVPRKNVGTGETVLLVGLAVGAGALAWWLWQRNKKKDGTTAAVGDDSSGFDMLGADDVP